MSEEIAVGCCLSQASIFANSCGGADEADIFYLRTTLTSQKHNEGDVQRCFNMSWFYKYRGGEQSAREAILRSIVSALPRENWVFW